MENKSLKGAEKDLEKMKGIIQSKKKLVKHFKQEEDKAENYIQELKKSKKNKENNKEYSGFEVPKEISKEEETEE